MLLKNLLLQASVDNSELALQAPTETSELAFQSSVETSKLTIPIGITANGDVVTIRLDAKGLAVVGMTGSGKSVLQSVIVYSAAYYFGRGDVQFHILDMHDCRESEYAYYYGDSASRKALNIAKLEHGVSHQDLVEYLDQIIKDIADRRAILGNKDLKEYNISASERMATINICLTDINFLRATREQMTSISDKITYIGEIGHCFGYNLIMFHQPSINDHGVFANQARGSYLIACKNAGKISQLEALGMKNLNNLRAELGESYLYNCASKSLVKFNICNVGESKDIATLMRLIKSKNSEN
ncbi:MAG: FtsK/SpoIIIE domain-containing protein [Clostridia bacterium]